MAARNKYIRLGAILWLGLGCNCALAQQNRVCSFVPTQPSDSAHVSAQNSQVLSVFYDAAGRPVQQVAEQAAPTGADLANLTAYDAFGRVQSQWRTQPFSNGQSGQFRSVEAFRTSSYAQDGLVTYSYEPSSLARRTSTSGVHTENLAVTTDVILSSAQPVYDFALVADSLVENRCVRTAPLRGLRQTDEDGNIIEKFYNGAGLLLLERKGHLGHADVLDTYYLYDDLDCLVCVLPPPAAHALSEAGSYSVNTDSALIRYAYLYRYDQHNRRTASRMPGGEWYRTLYDGDHRPVLSQSPVQAEQARWTFYRYDTHGRLYAKGALHNAAAAEALADSLQDALVADRYTGQGRFGYEAATLLGDSLRFEEVFFFDKYDFLTLQPFASLSGLAPDTTAYARGNLTGSLVFTTQSDSLAEAAVAHYDYRGRETMSVAFNAITGIRTDRAFTYDFLNHPLQSSTVYQMQGDTLRQDFSYQYDRAGRNTAATMNLIRQHANPQRNLSRHYSLYTASYDALGRIASTTALGGQNATAYDHLRDGRTRSLQSQYFSQVLHYDDLPETAGYHNGRISQIDTQNNGLSYSTSVEYDAFGRLVKGRVQGAETSWTESFAYDRAGNFTHLTRSQNDAVVQDISFAHNGHRLIATHDAASPNVPLPDYLATPTSSAPDAFRYDRNGNEVCNLALGIERAVYNSLNLPDSILSSDGRTLLFTYMADGRRVRTAYADAADCEIRQGDITAAADGFTRIEFPGGFLDLCPADMMTDTHLYVTDYLGSVTLVINAQTGAIEQQLDYLPSGAIFNAENYNFQPYRFCGKELLNAYGLHLYDSYARFQYATLPRFSSLDLLLELDYATSPYAYCANDFINAIDPWGLIKEKESYQITGVFPTVDVIWYRSYKASQLGIYFRTYSENANRYRYDNPMWYGFEQHQTYFDRLDEPNMGGGANKKGKLVDENKTLLSAAKAELESQSKSMYNPATGEWTAKTSTGVEKTFSSKFYGNQYTPTQKSVVQTAKNFNKISNTINGAGLAIDVTQSTIDYFSGNKEKGIIRIGATIIKYTTVAVVSGALGPWAGFAVSLALDVIENHLLGDYYNQ